MSFPIQARRRPLSSAPRVAMALEDGDEIAELLDLLCAVTELVRVVEIREVGAGETSVGVDQRIDDLSVDQVPYLANLAGELPPGEVALQRDLRDFLNSALVQAKVEMSDVSSGRADVYIQHTGFHFVIECKQTLPAWTEATPDQFLIQTAGYQQTSVRLGVLAVLDLSKRPPGEPHLDSCFTVRKVHHDGASDSRTVVVMRVPGNKQAPHTASKKPVKPLKQKKAG